VSSVVYHSAADLHEAAYTGRLATYGGGGFNVSMPLSRSPLSVRAMIDNMFLQPTEWTSEATRAMFIDFTTYNANVNLFCFVRYLTLLLVHTHARARTQRIVTATFHFCSSS
jgi:hypothetical protein